MFNEYKDIVTVPELENMLNVGRTTAMRLIHSGEIQTFRIGNKIKIPKLSVIQFVENKMQ
jgi:excisionase family DNA binding protein